MSNAFHFGVGDTLWTTPLMPTTGQGYAGGIILLIFMALFLRFLGYSTEHTTEVLEPEETQPLQWRRSRQLSQDGAVSGGRG